MLRVTRLGTSWNLIRINAQSVETVSILQPHYDCIPSTSFSRTYDDVRVSSHHVIFLGAATWTNLESTGVQSFMLSTADCCHWQSLLPILPKTESSASCNTINKQECKSQNACTFIRRISLCPRELGAICHKNDGIKYIIKTKCQEEHYYFSIALTKSAGIIMIRVFDYLYYWCITALWLHRLLSFICMLFHHNKLNHSRFMRQKSQWSSITSPLTPLHRAKHSSLMGSIPKGLRLPLITLIKSWFIWICWLHNIPTCTTRSTCVSIITVDSRYCGHLRRCLCTYYACLRVHLHPSLLRTLQGS